MRKDQPDRAERTKVLEELVSKPRWTGRSAERVPSPEAMVAARALNDLRLPISCRAWRVVGDFDGGMYVTFCGGFEPLDESRWPSMATVHISRTGGYSVSLRTEMGPSENMGELPDAKAVWGSVGSFLFSGTPSCYRCEHLVRPFMHGDGGKYRCNDRASVRHLKTFPFVATKCRSFSAVEGWEGEYLDFLAENTGNTTS